MTVYEQIQRAIDFIERNLFAPVRIAETARQANMSLRSFCHYFQAVTGFTYKEYLVKRRLAGRLSALVEGKEKIIDIALRSGYESHEAFSRAFKKEFGLTPIRYRDSRPALKGLEKILLVKEIFMGVIVKELPEMRVLSFDGFAPAPEDKAFAGLKAWLESAGYERPYRVFGYNIDRQGNQAHDPQNVGYRVLVTVDPARLAEADRPKAETIPPGRYVVTGIEGGDPAGGADAAWIGAGWRRLNEMIRGRGHRVRQGARCFEEELEPSRPGNLRLDLYLEIE